MRTIRILLLSTALFAATLPQAMLAQTITGSISGTVVDPSGASIPDGPVTLTNLDTGEKRETASADTGVFNFSALNPGKYSLAIRKAGFQALQRDGIVLTANQRLALGTLSLTVGEVTQSITVEQRGETVNLENADIGSVLSTDQVKSMPVRGRDPMNLLRILPGVSTLNLSQTGEIADGNAFGSNESLGGNVGSYTPTASGARLFWNTATVDGQVGSNPDWPGLFMAAVSMDGVSEVKINTNSYAAENGRNMGATINIVSKSGTKELHGTAYWFKRHEQFNANDFFNNRAGIPKPLYRFDTIGGAVGGPIFIPKHWNESRDKLFFFYSVENWDVHLPTGRTRLTVPTSLERAGNFSQTLDQNGALIVIRDPSANAPFPGNVIPANRIDRNGQVLLNLLPQPNQLDRSLTRGGYNYEWLETLDIPKWLHQLRLDYRPTSNDTISITPMPLAWTCCRDTITLM